PTRPSAFSSALLGGYLFLIAVANLDGTCAWTDNFVAVEIKAYKNGTLTLGWTHTWDGQTQEVNYSFTGLNFDGYIGFYVTKQGDSTERNLTIADFTLSGNEVCEVKVHDGYSQTAPDSVTVQKGGELTLTEPTRDYYTFAGYETLDGDTYDMTQVSSDAEIRAKWTARLYAITYVLDGGTNSDTNPTAYTVESVIALSAPTKEGYVFGGWYTDAEFSGDAVTQITGEGTPSEITLYAKWTEEEKPPVTDPDDGNNPGDNPGDNTNPGNNTGDNTGDKNDTDPQPEGNKKRCGSDIGATAGALGAMLTLCAVVLVSGRRKNDSRI
ncbi:MAG: InlB B-repeat-containing protein, partial [Clostridiales bacterium]|nr:InlB B-repeat-containing protein [Clostridiales bacterium]